MEGLWIGDVGEYKRNETRYTSLFITDHVIFVLYRGIDCLLCFLTAVCTPSHLMESRLPTSFS